MLQHLRCLDLNNIAICRQCDQCNDTTAYDPCAARDENMSELPAHASPILSPLSAESPKPQSSTDGNDQNHNQNPTTLPPILTPSLSPQSDFFPSTSASSSHPVPEQLGPGPRLLPVLPTVTCQVRARIPTTVGQEMWLHLYHNDVDDKEHLAIVFGPNIRSKSLDAPRPGETEKDRMIRGAYSGRLWPGRTDSRVSSPRSDAGVHSMPLQSGVGTKIQHSRVTESSMASRRISEAPLVRIHSECYTGETVWSARCDCGEQLDQAARLMSEATAPIDDLRAENQTLSQSHSDSHSLASAHPPDVNDHGPATSTTGSHQCSPPGGVIIYLRQEGRGIGLLSKLKAYNLQDLGHDTVMANLLLRHPADARSYGLATAMLLDLGLGGERGIRLLTNNPDKVRAVEGPNREVRVRERVGMVPLAWRTEDQGVRGPEVEAYISTKIEKFKHMFSA